MIRSVLVVALLLAVAPGGARAADDKHGPARFVRKDAKEYVVIGPGPGLDRPPSKSRPRAYYWFAKAKYRVEPGKIAKEEWRKLKARGKPLARGDKLLRKGKLAHLPTAIHFLATGTGFVALDHAPRPGDETSLTIVELDRKKSHAFALSDLVSDDVIRSIPYEGYGRRWLRGLAVDETERIVYVALRSQPHFLISIGMDSGTAKVLTADDYKALAPKVPDDVLALLFRVADSQDVTNLHPKADECLGDPERPYALRIEAARYRRSEMAREFITERINADPDKTAFRDILQAAAAAPATLGTDAIPILLKQVRGFASAGSLFLRGVAETNERSRACLHAMLKMNLPDGAAEAVLKIAVGADVPIPKLQRFLRSEDGMARLDAIKLANKQPKKYADAMYDALYSEHPEITLILGFFTKHVYARAFYRIRELKGLSHTAWQTAQLATKFQFKHLK